ncbi:MAG: hypothetical protein JWP53_2119, partial [Conexibacter sp.]|nr:hypothetical protein [Conexibacter sp.]
MTDGSSPNPNAGAAQRLGALADALQEATLPACVRDAGGRYVAVNPSFADLVGLESSRLVGKTDNALQPADVAHRVAELDALVLDAHGHLDARETVLARDGRRAMRACRFPVYDDGDPWAVCVVMAPGDDLQLGREQRERLQASVGQVATSGISAPAEEVVAEREARAVADAEAFAAREALAVEREARLEAEIHSRTAAEQLERQAGELEQLRQEADRAADERDRVAARVEELAAQLASVHDHTASLDGELAAARDRAAEAEARLTEASGR